MASAAQQTASGAAAAATAAAATAVTPGRRRLLLLLHGARIYDALVRDAIHELEDAGHEVTVRVTWDSGDVERFVTEAALLDGARRFDTIVAGGGDGTLNELVAALLRPPGSVLLDGGRTTVAQLPLGTANDLASASGISLDPREALALAVDPSAAKPVDVALVNGEVFLNIATVGPVSEVSSKDLSDTLKKALGPAAIVVSSLRQLFVTGLRPQPGVTITYPLDASRRPPPPASQGRGAGHPTPAATGTGEIEAAPPEDVVAAPAEEPAGAAEHGGNSDSSGGGGGKTAGAAVAPAKRQLSGIPGASLAAPPAEGLGRLRGDLLALVAGQSRQIGRMINACPHALLDDGHIDVTLAFGTPGQQARRLAADIAARGLEDARGGLLLLRVPWLLVEAPGGARLKTNRDGEPTMESSRLLFEVRPRAVRLHLPDGRLLLSGLPEARRAAAARIATPERPQRHRKGLLRDLLRAQQPPGRGARRAAALRAWASRGAWSAALFCAGFAAGAWHAARGGVV